MHLIGKPMDSWLTVSMAGTFSRSIPTIDPPHTHKPLFQAVADGHSTAQQQRTWECTGPSPFSACGPLCVPCVWGGRCLPVGGEWMPQ